MELNQEIDTALETLEALHFFTQGVKDGSAGHLEKARSIHSYLLLSGYPKLLVDIQKDIAGIRDHYGALAADQSYRKLLREAGAADGKGLIYISKVRIVWDLFSRPCE